MVGLHDNMVRVLLWVYVLEGATYWNVISGMQCDSLDTFTPHD